MKVLIVEDELSNREALRTLLESEGFAVCMASTCSGALRQLTMEKPDIVLLDIDLGEELNGIDVARVMGSDAHWRNIPIIVTSAIPAEAIRAKARAADAFAGLRALMVTKPIEAAVLLHEMRNMLGVL